MHRDVKPANLLVNASCELVICDFGLARYVGDDDAAPKTECVVPRAMRKYALPACPRADCASAPCRYVMTRWYRAPEVLCGALEYGPQADVWSAGLIIAELFTRGPMFKGTNSMHQLQVWMCTRGCGAWRIRMPAPRALQLIFECLGTPDAAILRRLATPDAFPEIRSLGTFAPQPFAGLLPGASADAIDLVGKMLRFDPLERITIEVCVAWAVCMRTCVCVCVGGGNCPRIDCRRRSHTRSCESFTRGWRSQRAGARSTTTLRRAMGRALCPRMSCRRC